MNGEKDSVLIIVDLMLMWVMIIDVMRIVQKDSKLHKIYEEG